MNFQRDSQGISGGGTIRFGSGSHITIGGRIARADIARGRQMLREAQRYYETAGSVDTGAWLDTIEQGAKIAGDIAKSPVGAGVAAYGGPYAAAAVAAAQGLPEGIKMLRDAGIAPEHAGTVAQLTSQDPILRFAAEQRVKRLAAAANKGDRRAIDLRSGLRAAMAKHNLNQIRELSYIVSVLRARLAALGDPYAYEPVAMPSQAPAGGSLFGTTAGPSDDRSIGAFADSALRRSQLAPQPAFRRMRFSGVRAPLALPYTRRA